HHQPHSCPTRRSSDLEKEVMVANTSPSIYESIDRDKNNPEPITIGKIEKEGEEIQVSEGRYMITGYEAGTVTIKDSDDAILYERSEEHTSELQSRFDL